MKLKFKYSEGQYVHNSNFNVDSDHKTEVVHYNETNEEQKSAEILSMVRRFVKYGVNYQLVVDPSNMFCLVMWNV